MTNYINIYVKKRNFVVRSRLSNTSDMEALITFEDTRITRAGNTRITRGGNTRVARRNATGYPRYISVKKRNFVIRTEVQHD